MVKKSIKIELSSGLEARPAAMLVQVASQYDSKIYLEADSKRVNAKSIMGMMAFQPSKGMEIEITAEGCDEEQAVLRQGAGDTQSLVKAPTQRPGEGQRAAEIQDVALDGAALCQTCNGLVDNGLIDRRRDVARLCALVDEGLDVAFGKNAAAAGDGVGAGRGLRGLVHLVGTHLQQGRHLVDESARAAGAAAVHADFGAVGQEQDLCILTAQLDDAVRRRDELFDRHTGGEHLLHERHAAAVGQAHTGGAGDG